MTDQAEGEQPKMDTSEEEFLRTLQSMFQVEAEEHLSAISSRLLELEKAPPAKEQAALIEAIYREAHTLKGAAGAVNMVDIEAICQPLESVLSAWKRLKITSSPALFDTLHRSVDTIGQILAAAGTGGHGPEDARIGQLVEQLTLLEKGETGGFAPTSLAQAAEEVIPGNALHPETVPRPSLASTEESVIQEPGKPHEPAASAEPFRPLEPAANARSMIPAPSAHPAASSPALPTAVDPVPGAPLTRGGPGRVEAGPAPSITPTVRVSTVKLDALLLQVEEMLSVKLTTEQRTEEIRELAAMLGTWKKEWSKVDPQLRALRHGNHGRDQQSHSKEIQSDGRDQPNDALSRVLELLEWSQQFQRSMEAKITSLTTSAEHDLRSVGGMVDYLLEDMKRVLMQPCASVLDLFPKMVRDLSREQGKEVDLVVRGREVEMDRRILEEIKEPLIHLLRNSVDHGMEKPEERKRHGKPARGTITLSVSPVDGSKVEILVSDDGSGIDTGEVRRAAVRHGIASPSEVDGMGEQESLELIFRSEVSTSPLITEISGRGLGLAIVREKAEKLGGRAAVETELHRGTLFRIILPVALATFRGILVEAGGQVFVIPTATVERVVRLRQEEIHTVENREAILVEGRAVSLAWLHQVLEIPAGGGKSPELRPVIILGAGEKRIAFAVDRVVDEQEVLVKGLGKYLRRVRNVAGATVLGSGKVIPVLNVSDLLKSALKMAADPASQSRPEVQTKRKSILVAEDSITSRMLLKTILSSAGYNVKTAVDGVEAFTTLKTAPFDLVVSDVEMPRMGGLDLTAKIRADRELSDLPVVLVTSLESQEHRERGIDVGANAYIVKSSFEGSNLLEVIRRLL